MNKIMAAVILRLVIYPLSILTLISLYFFFIYACPKRNISRFSPKNWGIEYRDAVFTTGDGLKLAGWFIPNKASDKAIIICHGYPMDKGDVFGMTEFLAREYNLFYFDFRAMGRSEGRVSTSGWREREDFLAAVSFVRAKGFRDIGAFGFSMGAAVIFLADSPDVKCIVSDSSYARLSTELGVVFASFGTLRGPLTQLMRLWSLIFLGVDINSVNPVTVFSRTETPVLLIHCQNDSVIPVQEALELHESFSGSELFLVPEGDHGESSHSTDYEPRIRGFFRKNL